ncbi:MAG: hypothetical protein H8E44_15995 [Planctomycetes bacterium]|nr:hypothetical protein [Planctomycetota bacterium]
MANKLWVFLALLAVFLCSTSFTAAVAQEDAVFDMKEASVLDEDGSLISDYFRYGVVALQGAPCSTTATKKVVYPKLKSKSPLYGHINFGGGFVGYGAGLGTVAAGKGYHFVIDESAPDDSAKAEADPPASRQPVRTRAAVRARASIAESVKIAAKYDTLYFDANRDLDLTNDPVRKVSKKRPTGLFSLGGGSGTQVFDFVHVKRDGDAQGKDATKLLPWLNLQSRKQAYLILMSTVVRKGSIRVGGQEYEALMGSRYHGSTTTLLVKPAKSSARWKPMPLNMLHQTDGEFYTVSVDPNGSKVKVSPYEGKFGQLQIGARGRDIDKLGVVGALQSKDQIMVSLGKPDYFYTAERPKECRLPVGDYQTSSLTVDYGSVTVRLSASRYDTSGRVSSRSAFGIKIREDKPFVLDFANQPTVAFTGPTKGHVYRPGDKVSIKALMLEPELGMMIRGLYDLKNKTGTRSATDEQGKSVSVPRYASLHPTVSITDSSGKEVANGTMPFG